MQTARDLTEVLFDVSEQLRILRQSSDGVSRENPLEAMKRLGELAGELEQHRQHPPAGAAQS